VLLDAPEIKQRIVALQDHGLGFMRPDRIRIAKPATVRPYGWDVVKVSASGDVV
jgi:hypothetical protein